MSKIADTEQVGEQVTEQVKRLLVGIGDKEWSIKEFMDKNREGSKTQLKEYIIDIIISGLSMETNRKSNLKNNKQSNRD